VLPNGNLLVSGEKQIAINQGNEFIRFSGIVNPVSVTGANTVQSTQVADARIEYRANGYIDETQQMGWLQRFFERAAFLRNPAMSRLFRLAAACACRRPAGQHPGQRRTPQGSRQHRRRAPQPAGRLRPGGRPRRLRRPDHPDPFTVQSIINMLGNLGVTLPPGQSLQLKNVAAVMVTASLPPFARPGQQIDVTVSSMGNARSLKGGTLVMTPSRAWTARCTRWPRAAWR
jgi:hypothetical protein